MKDQASRKYLYLDFAIAAFLFLCLFPVICKPCLWIDEAGTVNIVRRSVPDLIRITAMDVHPPLYYLVTKLFVTLLGDHIFVYHLPPLLCHLGLILLAAWFLHRYFDPRLSLLTTLCLCAAPNMLRYALQVRMYSMAMLLVAGSYCLTYAIMKKYEKTPPSGFKALWKEWMGLALLNVAAAYTHYFAGVAAVSISLFLLGYLFWKRRKLNTVVPWLIYCGIMVVLYLPWLPVLFGQMGDINGSYWIEPMTEAVLHSYPDMLFLTTDQNLRYLLIVIFLAGSFLCVLHFGKDCEFTWIMGCFAVFLIWLAFGVGYSVLRNPILTDRYLVILLPLVWIPPLYGFVRAEKGYLLAGVILVFTLCFIDHYEEEYDYYALNYNIPLLDTIETRAQEGDLFFHFYFGDLYIYQVYFPEYEHYILSSALEAQDDAMIALSKGHAIETLEELPEISGSIWCSNGDWIASFEDLGYEVETIDLGTSSIYRAYKEKS